MSLSGNKHIKRAEKQLAAFHEYSFHNYCELMLILVNNKRFLENDATIKCRLTKIELLMETEETIASLHKILWDPDKHDNFSAHVKAVMAITRKIDYHLPVAPVESQAQWTIALDLVKRFFISRLTHT